MSKRTLAALFAGLAISPAVMADTVSMRYVSSGAGRHIRMTYQETTREVFAGQLRHEITEGTGAGASLVGTHLMYCADLTQGVASSTTTFQVVPVAMLPMSPMQPAMGAGREQAVFDLFAAANGSQYTSSDTAAAAFQIALWEIISDYDPEEGAGSLDITSGSFSASLTDGSPITGGVASNLAALFEGIGSNASGEGIVGFGSGTGQDQILPSPGSAALAIAGASLLGFRRRRS